MTAPTAAATQLTTSPVRMHAIPIAKPIGYRLGGGRCGFSSWCSLNPRPRRDLTRRRAAVSTTYQLPQAPPDGAILTHRVGRGDRDPVLLPPSVDERPHLGAHLDLGRPRARALVGPLGGRVD